MRKKNLWKRSLAIILAAATMIGSSGINDYGFSANVSAAEIAAPEGNGSWVATSLITNGDFENKTATDDVPIAGWTLTSTLASTDTATIDTDSNISGTNATNLFKFWSENGGDFSLAQTLSAVPAGIYRLSFSGTGNTGLITATVSNQTTLAGSEVAWNAHTAFTSNVFELAEAADLTITVGGTLAAGSWGDIDNVVLEQWQASSDHTFEELTALKNSVPADYTTLGFTAASVEAMTSALSLANACTNGSASSDIEAAYQALSTALNGLTFDGDLFVTKIANYNADSIRGVDVSSYISIMDSFDALKAQLTEAGTVEQNVIDNIGFKDWDGNVLTRQGFFDLLAASGVNYVRIRVWNNPYTAADGTYEAGKGYGGGNNDLAKAIEMGKYTTEAGMKVLIDFHFSDFWADPGKQQAPKAWRTMSVDEKKSAISTYVTESLTTLVTNNGINVGMVQIGNETNDAMCGESDWTNLDILFDAGCDAVHAINPDILTAVHFTNPETSNRQTGYAAKLADYDGDGDGTKEGVSYDVFATSYYPYWHGTLDNLTSVLSTIASTYDKYVMVAETSWATTLEDGDGWDNTVRIGSNDTGNDYSFTVQGQANEVRSVANAINNVNVTLEDGQKAALGFFYWEPAWIPVQYAYDAETKIVDEDILASNKVLWETYGSGWASSFAAQYDTEDAGRWFGGSAVDNQAVFDFDGSPLASLHVFKYLQYGSVTDVAVEQASCNDVAIEVGSAFTANSLPANATVLYNDGTTTDVAVNWSANDIAYINDIAATNRGIGRHTVAGTLSTDATQTVRCTVYINAKNIVANNSFENGSDNWSITGTGYDISTSDPHSGSKSLHFYSASAFSFTATQQVPVTTAGIYKANYYIQGSNNTGSNDGEAITLSATTSAGDVSTSTDNVLIDWGNWLQPEVSDIEITQDMIDAGNATITLSITVTANAGAWGTIDDVCLYLDEETKVTPVAVNTLDIKLASGNYIYDGTAKQPAVTVKNGDVTLAPSNYTVSYKNNTNAGTATVTITGANSRFTGTATKTFTIAKASKTIRTGAASYTKTYGNKAFSLNAAASNKDAVTYTSNNAKAATVSATGVVTIKGAGTAKITISSAGTANYNAAPPKNVTITVKKASKTIKVSKSSYTKEYGDKAFSLGASVSSKEKISYKSSNTKIATVSSSGKVTLKGSYGKVVITVSSPATTNYNAASKKVTITVAPKDAKLSSVKSSRSGQLTVKWSKDSKVKGYMIQYSTSKNFKGAKTVTIKKSSATSTTIKSLKKGKKYYVRVRSYITVDRKNVYSDYSASKNATVRKK